MLFYSYFKTLVGKEVRPEQGWLSCGEVEDAGAVPGNCRWRVGSLLSLPNGGVE